ncbi:hypothetical protein ACFHW2_15735 [Actinomadura sp. LOL_016]|uniref:hypothetical protein n=1 Tax=unclassified Actinomadura TaxID=2626254 RepID=UPI003A808944
MWTRASVMAVGAAAEIIPADGMRVDDDGVSADIKGHRWMVALAPDDEAVLGVRDSGGPAGDPADLPDGLPERLSWKRLREDAAALGYVYWYTDGAWHRAECPADLDDDGLGASLEHLADDHAAIGALTSDENGRRAVADVLAKARENTLRPADVTTMLGVLDPDVGSDAARTRAALDAAVRTGLLAGTRPPLIEP